MATTTQRNYRPRNDQTQKRNEYSVYARNMISMKIHLNMREIGDSTKLNLERKIVQRTEGKCIPEGYVRPDSVKIVTYSSGVIKMNLVEFQVVFECLICNPVEGQVVECTTKTITKAGIHAEVMTDRKFIPMKVFVARDHNYANHMFGDVKEDQTISVRIIGKRFELNDPYIVAIASLVDSGREQSRLARPTAAQTKMAKPRITLLAEEAINLNLEDEDEYVEPELEFNPAEANAPISIPTVNPNE